MPELPDVEHFRRYWAAHAAGQRVADVIVTDTGILRDTTTEDLRDALAGERFLDPERHGKWLLARTTGPTLAIHFGMTGDLEWAGSPAGRHRHDRVIFVTEGGEMRYRNMRKFGGVWLATDPDATAVVSPGRDALALSPAELRRLLASRRGAVKAALMDQRFLAGVGNLMADEILWQARLHPARRFDSLSDAERTVLARSIRSVLREAVERYGMVERGRSWLLSVRGEPGATCPRCGTPLGRTVAAGRTTWYCPKDQPPP